MENRLSFEQALELMRTAPLAQLGRMAVEAKERVSGDKVFYNRNIHIEPTNICLFRCSFCSYRRGEGEEGAWYLSMDEVRELARGARSKDITEVHIVGGVHPSHDLQYYCDLIRIVKSELPDVAIKAYTAVELYYIIEKAGITLEEGLQMLKDAGMTAIPGGGAEIFDTEVRSVICPEKSSAEEWLETHRVAHGLGISTNATMLFGHIEEDHHIVDHLMRLRELQDQTGGFNAFIPLKFKRANNTLGLQTPEAPITRVMRVMAISRLVLDNVPHLKAYWPMLGVEATEMALSFGADDIDGTIDDTTKIYSMAGGTQKPIMTTAQMETLVRKAGYTPIERDTLYNTIVR